MSEQLPQNKNEQNDNSAFDPDLYQDFDAEAGVQADLAAFNSRMDEIRTNSWISNEEMRRGRQEANEAQLTNARLQLAQARREGASNEELVAKAKDLTAAIPATNKYDIVAQDTSGKSEPSERKSLLDDLKERPLGTGRSEVQPAGDNEEEASATEPEQTSTSSTPQQRPGMSARAKAALAARRENRERSRQTRNASQENTGTNSLLDDLIARPLPSTVRVKAAEEAKAREAEETPESKTETQAATTSSEDQPGNAPAEPKERRRHAKGKAKAAAPVAATANTATAPAPSETDSDNFFGGMTQNMTAESFTVDSPQTAGQTDAESQNSSRPFPQSRDPQVRSDDTVVRAMQDVEWRGVPYIRPGEAVPRGGNGDDYDFDPQGNNTAAAPDTSANSDDAFAHLFRNPSGAPEASTTYTTPLDVVATPGENTVTGRALVTDAMNRLGKNFETGYAYNNTAYFVHNRRTGENMVIHISDLDDPDYLKNQLEGIKDMNERGMTRSEKVAYKIGNLASRVANSDRMQKIESRWDKRRAGIQVGEGVMVDMTPDIEARRGDRTRADARRAEHIARKEERAEARRQRLEDEPSFYKRHRKALIGTLSGLILADVIAGGIAANNAFNHDDHHNTTPRVSASPTPGASHSASPSARPSASPSASSSSEAASPSATTSPSAEAPSATPAPTSPTVNPNRPNAPEGGQGGSGVTTRNEQHAHENLTFITRDGKQQVTATLKEGGTIFEAGHDAGLTDTQIMNAVQRAGITEAQAASLTPNQIVDFTPSGNSYEVKLR